MNPLTFNGDKAMDKFKVWVALAAISTVKIVGVLTLFLGVMAGLLWIGKNFSPDTILIGIGVIGIAGIIWIDTLFLHDKWKRGKINFKWEKK